MDEQAITKKLLKKSWGTGPWNEEPDGFEPIPWSYKGYSCSVQRNSLGAWCGYVLVSKDHPLAPKEDGFSDLDMHGGLTYCEDKGSFMKIGFDCAHYRDLIPGIESLRKSREGKIFTKEIEDTYSPDVKELIEKYRNLNEDIYRTYDYARSECESIVEQLLKD